MERLQLPFAIAFLYLVGIMDQSQHVASEAKNGGFRLPSCISGGPVPLQIVKVSAELSFELPGQARLVPIHQEVQNNFPRSGWRDSCLSLVRCEPCLSDGLGYPSFGKEGRAEWPLWVAPALQAFSVDVCGHFRQYCRLSGLFMFWHCLHWP